MILLIILTAVSAVFYASFFEYMLHKYVMHKKVRFFPYPFNAHAVTHHGMFPHGTGYHLHERSGQDIFTIPMAWWNGPALVTIASIPWLAISWATGWWSIVITVSSVIAFYYLAYESLHFFMHLPVGKFNLITGSRWFKYLDGHHHRHHKHMGKNLNVVLPIWDLLLGTYKAAEVG